MDVLPTEVDDCIVQRLPVAALNAMSKVSRTYHAIAMPHLYRDIVFDLKRGFRIYQLLATLLERKSLAAHIRAIAIENETGRIPGFNYALYTRLLKHTNNIQQLIKALVADTNNDEPQSTWSWICSIYEGIRKPSIQGGPFALLLCLATNLERLDLKCEMMPSVAMVLSDDWRGRASQEAVPFHRLKVVRVQHQFDALSLHALEALHIVQDKSHDHRDLERIYTTVLPPTLRTLKLENVRFLMTFMEAAVSAPALANLKELVVTRAGCPSATYPWRDYDFSRLSNLLVRHIPKLEVFKWSNMVWDIHPYVQPFGRLSGLKILSP